MICSRLRLRTTTDDPAGCAADGRQPGRRRRLLRRRRPRRSPHGGRRPAIMSKAAKLDRQQGGDFPGIWRFPAGIPFPPAVTPILLWGWAAANAVALNNSDNSCGFSPAILPVFSSPNRSFAGADRPATGRNSARIGSFRRGFGAGRGRLDTAFPRRQTTAVSRRRRSEATRAGDAFLTVPSDGGGRPAGRVPATGGPDTTDWNRCEPCVMSAGQCARTRPAGALRCGEARTGHATGGRPKWLARAQSDNTFGFRTRPRVGASISAN